VNRKPETVLNGIKLDCETIEDSFAKSIAKYEIPYSDQAMLEDMGQNARKVRIRCYFYSDTYEKHHDLIFLLYGEDAFELQHPEYGLLSGSIESVTVRHDDREQTAEIDFNFVEGTTEIEPTVLEDVESGIENLYESVLEEAQDNFIEKVKSALGTEASGILDKVLDPALDIYEQFIDISMTARAYVKKIDTAVRTFESTLSGITTPANRLISTIDFATNLPGRVIGSIAKVANKYSQLYETIIDAPDRFIQSFRDGMAELETEVFPNHSRASYTADSSDANTHTWQAYKSLLASEASLQAGYAFSADEENRQAQKRLENVKSFDTSGNYIKAETVQPAMNVREIETTLYIIRKMIQEAVDNERQNESLKQMALTLLKHISAIKLEREKIITIELDNETPLHLVCLKYGLPYQAAERILAINNISKPNFTAGEIDIYAR